MCIELAYCDLKISLPIFVIFKLIVLIGMKTPNNLFYMGIWVLWHCLTEYFRFDLDETKITSWLLFLISFWVLLGVENEMYKNTRICTIILFVLISSIQTIIGQEERHVLPKIFCSCIYVLTNFFLSKIRIPFDYVFQIILSYWILSCVFDIFNVSMRFILFILIIRAYFLNSNSDVLGNKSTTVINKQYINNGGMKNGINTRLYLKQKNNTLSLLPTTTKNNETRSKIKRGKSHYDDKLIINDIEHNVEDPTTKDEVDLQLTSIIEKRGNVSNNINV